MNGRLNAPVAIGVALVFLASSGCGAPTGAQPAAPAQPSGELPAWQVEWERIVAEARKEGEVIVWGNAGTDARQFEKETFEKAYPGIRVTHFAAPTSSERDSRFLQEFQAGIAKVDVMIGGSAGVNARVKPAGGLQDLRPFLILPEVTDLKNWQDEKLIWVDDEQMYMLQSDTSVNAAVAIHSSVDLNELQSWWDLLNPKWKGKIVMTDPRMSGAGFARGLFFYYTPELGPEYTRRFYSETGIVFSSDTRQNVEWTASGRMLINVSPQTFDIIEAQKIGVDIRTIPNLRVNGKEANQYSGSSGIAFVPNLDPLPHPNAARVYINWFYSRAGQQALQDIRLAVSRRADLPKDKLPPDIVPKPGVEYMNLNHYTESKVVQDMRDDVSRRYPG